MTRDDIIELMQLITSFDNRNSDAYMETSWLDAARVQRWTYEGACAAVRAHFSSSTEWIMPGHVTQWLRAQRSGPPPVSELRSLPVGPPASVASRRAAIALFRESVGTREIETTTVIVKPESVSKLDPIGVHRGDPVRGFAWAIRRSNEGRGDRA